MTHQPFNSSDMKRQYLPHRLLTLFLLLCAAGVRAQSYSLQYWFDQYAKTKVNTVSFSGTHFNRAIDVSGLTPGFHHISMRVKASDGNYSPVTISSFIKFTPTTNSNLEYWFDDNYATPATMPIDTGTETVQILDLDFSDMEKFPLGFHRLNFRIAAQKGNYSPVYSTPVMRLPAGQASEVTYWLDDDYDPDPQNHNVVSGRVMTDKISMIKATLDFSTASKGVHRLHYRITTNGYDDGVVYEVPVLITELYNKKASSVVSESQWMDEEYTAPFTISNPQAMITRNYTLYAKNYAEGQHVFHVQYQNSAGVWGEPNATYFYKEPSGALRIGVMPEDEDGIDDVERSKMVSCTCEQGIIYIDCLSPSLSSLGIVTVYDIMGKLVARQTVQNSDGIHARLNVQAYGRQLLVVRMVCGNLTFNKKIIVK